MKFADRSVLEPLEDPKIGMHKRTYEAGLSSGHGNDLWRQPSFFSNEQSKRYLGDLVQLEILTNPRHGIQ